MSSDQSAVEMGEAHNKAAEEPTSSLPVLVPGDVFDSGKWAGLDAALVQTLTSLAEQWTKTSEPASKKKKRPAPVEAEHTLDPALPLAKRLVLSHFRKLPAQNQERDAGQAAISQALLEQAKQHLAGKLNDGQIQQVLDAKRAGPLYLMALAELAIGPISQEWNYAHLVAQADKIGATHLVYLSQLDAQRWQEKQGNVKDMVTLCMDSRAMECFQLVAELTGAGHGFEAGRLKDAALNRACGVDGLQSVKTHFETLKAHLLAAGFQDLPQQARQGREKKGDPSLRNRILAIANRAGTKQKGKK